MKKENDEITDLFRTRLADAGMSVRDGFWEELSQEIPVACQHRRRILRNAQPHYHKIAKVRHKVRTRIM